MNFKPNETAVLGLLAAVIIVVGFLLYFISTFFPIPGLKFVFLAPLLSFVFTLILKKVNKKGIITIFSLILGGLLSIITVFMGIAILLTGFLTELTGVVIELVKEKTSIIYTAAFFPVYSFLTFGIVTQLLLGKVFFSKDNLLLVVVIFVIIYVLGLLGAYLALGFLKRINRFDDSL